MADMKPIKRVGTSSSTTGLAEFTATDTIGVADGGTGATTAAAARANLGVVDMVGSTGTQAGTAGLVPAPGISDNTKFLRGDGSWADPPGGSGSLGTAAQVSFTPSGGISANTVQAALQELDFEKLGIWHNRADIPAIDPTGDYMQIYDSDQGQYTRVLVSNLLALAPSGGGGGGGTLTDTHYVPTLPTDGSDIAGALNTFFAGLPDGASVMFPFGRKYSVGQVTVNCGTRTLRIDFNGCTFEMRTTGTAFTFEGSRGALTPCTLGSTAARTTATFTTLPAGVGEGVWMKIVSDDVFEFSQYDDHRCGQHLPIQAISGNTITFRGKLVKQYMYQTNVRAHVMHDNSKRLVVCNGHFRKFGSTRSGRPLQLNHLVYPEVYGCTQHDGSQGFIRVQNCVGARVHDMAVTGKLDNSPSSGYYGYAFFSAWSHGTMFYNLVGQNTRHFIEADSGNGAVGSSNPHDYGINFYMLVNNITVSCQISPTGANDDGDAALSTHAGDYASMWSNIIVTNSNQGLCLRGQRQRCYNMNFSYCMYHMQLFSPQAGSGEAAGCYRPEFHSCSFTGWKFRCLDSNSGGGTHSKFYNCYFSNDQEPVLDNAWCATSGGCWEFLGCHFEARSGISAEAMVSTFGSMTLIMRDCLFDIIGANYGSTWAPILCGGSTGNVPTVIVSDCHVRGNAQTIKCVVDTGGFAGRVAFSGVTTDNVTLANGLHSGSTAFAPPASGCFNMATGAALAA